MQLANIPVVLVDNCLFQTRINCVVSDDEGSAYQVTRHLLEHGHTRIAFLSGPQGWAIMREALDRWPDLTAVFGVNDSVAIGALRSAAELARQAPRDLAVFGFDDISRAALNQPPLSTVHVYKRRIGQLAAQCVLDCIAQPEAAKLVLRASCGHAD